MKRINLIQVKHDVKIGNVCDYIEPNITEDCIFYYNDKPIGFYLKKMPEKLCKLANLANNEFLSKNVPKMKMNRTSAMKNQLKTEWSGSGEASDVIQLSTIIGSIPPRNFGRRPYCSKSSVHAEKTAQIFIKAMLMLATESEKIIQDILPEVYLNQKKEFETIAEKWRFGNIFTSSISNFNISAPFHRDTGNVNEAVNVIITKRLNSKGGCLNIPDYGATIDQADNSMLVYPAGKNVHGVTPIIPTHSGGYRNSLIFYPLKAFKNVEK